MSAFKIEMGGKYILRGDLKKKPEDRAKVRVLATDVNGSQPVVAVVSVGGYDSVRQFNSDGQYMQNLKGDGDLIPEPVVRRYERWVNVYREGPVNHWETKERADQAASKDRIACLYIVREFYEGEGL